jgi:hypothetical protein
MSQKLDHLIHAAAGIASSPATTAPPATIAALSFAGVGLSDWLILLSIVWIVLQISFFLLDKYLKFCRRK